MRSEFNETVSVTTHWLMDLSPVLIKPDRTDNSTRTAQCLGIELLFTCNVPPDSCFSIWKTTEQLWLVLASKQSSSYLCACQELFPKELAYSPDVDFKVILSKLSISGKVYFISLFSRLDITQTVFALMKYASEYYSTGLPAKNSNVKLVRHHRRFKISWIENPDDVSCINSAGRISVDCRQNIIWF